MKEIFDLQKDHGISTTYSDTTARHHDVIVRVINDVEYIYFKDSMKLMVRHPNTDIPSSFEMDDLRVFLNIVSDELRKELIDDAMSKM